MAFWLGSTGPGCLTIAVATSVSPSVSCLYLKQLTYGALDQLAATSYCCQRWHKAYRYTQMNSCRMSWLTSCGSGSRACLLHLWFSFQMSGRHRVGRGWGKASISSNLPQLSQFVRCFKRQNSKSTLARKRSKILCSKRCPISFRTFFNFKELAKLDPGLIFLVYLPSE